MGFVLACAADDTAHADTKHQIYQEALAQFEAAENIVILDNQVFSKILVL